MHYFPWIIPSIIASSICFILAILVWKQRKTPAAKSFYWLLLSVFIWSICQAFTFLNEALFWKVIIGKIQYIGIVFTPVSYLVFSLVMINYAHLINLRRILYLCVIPMITLVLVMTNEYHHLIWQTFTISQDNPIFVNVSYGLWFAIHTVYSYLLIASAAIAAIVVYFKDSNSHVNIKLVIIAPLAVVVPNIIYLQDASSFTRVDLTPLGFALGMLMFSWALLKENLLQLVPIARDVLFQKMKDSILVLGPDFRIVDINISAAKLFKVNINQVVGTLFVETISEQKILDQLINKSYSEISIKKQYFQALRTLVTIDKTGTIGYLIVLRDITLLKETQHNLVETQAKLEQANRSYKNLANTDMLTNLPNRRRFFEKFSDELERADRHQSVFCLLIMDLDFFKKINDSFGHPEGDAVLKRVAKVMKKTVREADYLGRIGGEEFGIILTETNKEEAKLFAERIRKAIADCHREKETAITVSIGLTQRLENDDLESIYDRADKALYQSKSNGRNMYTLG